jgi:hypothetical protein
LTTVELIAWPERDHNLGATGADSHALIGWQEGEVGGRIAGYRRAAEILAEHVLAHRGDLDLVVFPLAGCWRQHVELRLKDLLADLQVLLGRPAEPRHHHDIERLGRKSGRSSYEHIQARNGETGAPLVG